MHKRKGFTLIELIVAIFIVSLIASAVFVSVKPAQRIELAKDSQRWADLTAIYKAIDTYTADYGYIPSDFSSSTLEAGQKAVLCTSPSELTCDGQTRGCAVIDDANFLGKYIGYLPVDPDKLDDTDTGYFMTRTASNNIALGVCDNDSIPEITVTVGSRMANLAATQYLTQTSDLDFNAGATTTAEVGGAGSAGYVIIGATTLNGDTYSESFTSTDIHVDGNEAYICRGTQGIRILDISDPENISALGSYDNGICYELYKYGNYLYVSDLSQIDIIDVSNTSSPSPVLSFAPPVGGNIGRLTSLGSTLFFTTIVDGCGGFCSDSYLHSYSLTNPESPSFLDSSNAFFDIYNHISVVGNYAYVAGPDYGLTWYDISNPSSISTPVDSTSLGTSDIVYDLLVKDSYVYVSQAGRGIRVMSTSTDSLAYTYSDYTNIRGMDIDGNDLYGANTTNLISLDISNPLSFVLNATYTSPSAYDVNYQSDYAYTIENGSGVISHVIPIFATSGSFVSSILDTGSNSGYETISWNASTPAGTTLSMKARTSNDSGMSGATAWSSCDTVTNGSDISSNNCVTDGHQYIQYQAIFSTSDTSTSSILYDVSIGYTE